MVKTEQLAGLSTSLGIQSLRPPSIPRCIFRSQYYNLLHTLDLIARNQPKYCSDVPDDAGDDDTHDLDQDAGQSISSQTEVNHPLGQMNKRIPSVAESQHSKVPESSKPRTKTLLDLMKERQQAKLEQEASS
uniref:Uncharacterized protein n=1 Tax=Plectus sambesii TaxID=2011161 RepID=A0A914UZ44_9BILA